MVEKERVTEKREREERERERERERAVPALLHSSHQFCLWQQRGGGIGSPIFARALSPSLSRHPFSKAYLQHSQTVIQPTL